jgi:hypothetical protein
MVAAVNLVEVAALVGTIARSISDPLADTGRGKASYPRGLQDQKMLAFNFENDKIRT